jgi:putative transposase
MRFTFIEQHVGTFPVRLMCRVLEVSPSGFYAWRSRPESPRAASDRHLLAKVHRLQAQHHGRYGSPRMPAALRAEGHSCSRARRANDAPSRYPRSGEPRFSPAHDRQSSPLPVAPNSLAQRLLAPAPSRIWLADITYIATGDGWLYLAAILDLATHDRGMGIAGSHADRIGARGPADGRTTPAPRARAHSPFGPLESTQYAASAYSSQLAELGAIASMSRRGCCYDNAPMEAFPYVEGRARPAA